MEHPPLKMHDGFWCRPVKQFVFFALAGFMLFASGCAGIQPTESETGDGGPEERSSEGQKRDDRRYDSDSRQRLADPLKPVNRVLFQFNDKLYFWVMKPAAQGYSFVVPRPARKRVGNFFDNIAAPIRIANCFLQLNLKGTGVEIGRLGINSTVGVLGLGDPASGWGLQKRKEDFDQTLGVYGVGQGIYLVLPVFGPSSLRGVVGTAGDVLADPLTYYPEDTLLRMGIGVSDRVNSTSLRIGDYEEIKDQLSPYSALKNGYRQHRKHRVEENLHESILFSRDSDDKSD